MLIHIPRPLSGCLFFAHQHFPLCFISSAQEQIVGMLHNMSLNKKCHSHLANGVIINFITSVYQTEFYKTYGSRAESDAQRRTIKTILHTLTRLASDSPTLGAELLEQWHLPDLTAGIYPIWRDNCSASIGRSSSCCWPLQRQPDLSPVVTKRPRHKPKPKTKPKLKPIPVASPAPAAKPRPRRRRRRRCSNSI